MHDESLIRSILEDDLAALKRQLERQLKSIIREAQTALVYLERPGGEVLIASSSITSAATEVAVTAQQVRDRLKFASLCGFDKDEGGN